MSESNTPQTLEFSQEGFAEGLARADLHDLLANLFFQPPDQVLLDQISASGNTDNPDNQVPLASVWTNLVEAAKHSRASDWKAEYDSSFWGVGKPNVFLYGSYYLAGHFHEKPLLNIRRSLLQFGLGASDSIAETEDHIAALFEVMRCLIAGEDVTVANLTN